MVTCPRMDCKGSYRRARGAVTVALDSKSQCLWLLFYIGNVRSQTALALGQGSGNHAEGPPRRYPVVCKATKRQESKSPS
jgi:hypothetical protein